MLRRFVLIAVLVALAGLTVGVLSGPADAAVTSSNITSPADGTHFFNTNETNPGTVQVKGTSNDTSGTGHVDIRCYYQRQTWQALQTNVAVGTDGKFSTTISKGDPYGTCVLRAVPSGLAPGASAVAFTGPRVTAEWTIPKKVSSGLNAGKVYDYYVLFQGAHAMNDYASAGTGGLWDSRLQYSNGYSSYYLWYGDGILSSNEANAGLTAGLRVDGHYAYLPRAAEGLFPNNPGLRALTFDASRNSSTGTTTIHETDPVVVCPDDTYPPTALTCPQFNGAGMRLERTIVATDGGREVRITDKWRSTDNHPHTVSAHYDQWIQGFFPDVKPEQPVGLKFPWLGSAYKTYTGDAVYPGPTSVPRSLFVHGYNNAPDGSTIYPRGAISFDVAPHEIHRVTNRTFTLRDEGIKVPAGGVRVVREAFVMGTKDSEVAAKAATQRQQINPYRPDGLIKAKSATKYVGNNRYNATGTKQSALLGAAPGSTATFDIAVQNDGTTTDSFRVKGPGSTTGFAVRYLFGASGTSDITNGVTHGTFTLTTLAPGQSRTIRIVVKVRAGATIGALGRWLVVATSAHDTTRKDAVRAVVKVV